MSNDPPGIPATLPEYPQNYFRDKRYTEGTDLLRHPPWTNTGAPKTTLSFPSKWDGGNRSHARDACIFLDGFPVSERHQLGFHRYEIPQRMRQQDQYLDAALKTQPAFPVDSGTQCHPDPSDNNIDRVPF